TGHAVHLVLGIAAHEDVVAALADHLVEAAAADKNVIAGNVIAQKWIEVVAWRTVLRTELDPVVTFIAGFRQVRLRAVDEIVTLARKDRRDVVPGNDEVLAVATENDIRHLERQERMAVRYDVVTRAGVNDVRATHIGNDIVAITAEQVVIAEAAFDAVV